MNRVDVRGRTLYCGSWRIRDGVLSHRYMRPAPFVDLMGLPNRFLKRLLSGVLKQIGADISRGDRRDLESILEVFTDEERNRQGVVRKITSLSE